jgi:hypothetical protein
MNVNSMIVFRNHYIILFIKENILFISCMWIKCYEPRNCMHLHGLLRRSFHFWSRLGLSNTLLHLLLHLLKLVSVDDGLVGPVNDGLLGSWQDRRLMPTISERMVWFFVEVVNAWWSWEEYCHIVCVDQDQLIICNQPHSGWLLSYGQKIVSAAVVERFGDFFVLGCWTKKIKLMRLLKKRRYHLDGTYNILTLI